MIGKSDVYRRALRALGFIAAMMLSQRASAQETAVTRIDLPLGRAYPYRAAEVITRVTVANTIIVSNDQPAQNKEGYFTLAVMPNATQAPRLLQLSLPREVKTSAAMAM